MKSRGPSLLFDACTRRSPRPKCVARPAGVWSRRNQSKGVTSATPSCLLCPRSSPPTSAPGRHRVAENRAPLYGDHVLLHNSQRPARKYGATFTAAGGGLLNPDPSSIVKIRAASRLRCHRFARGRGEPRVGLKTCTELLDKYMF